jgi:hypothetical protein
MKKCITIKDKLSRERKLVGRGKNYNKILVLTCGSHDQP